MGKIKGRPAFEIYIKPAEQFEAKCWDFQLTSTNIFSGVQKQQLRESNGKGSGR